MRYCAASITRHIFIVSFTFLFSLSTRGQQSTAATEDALIKTALDTYNKNQFYLAIGYCTRVLNMNFKNATAYNVRGSCYVRLKEYDKAISDFIGATRYSPRYTSAWMNMAIAYKEKGYFNQALTAYTKVLAYEPANKEVYMGRALIYYDQKNYDETIKDLSSAIRIDQKYAEAYLYRGFCYQNKNNFDEAIKDYNNAIELVPTYEAYWNRSICFLQKNLPNRALSDLAKAIALDPKRTEAYYQRGNLYLQQRKNEQALADFTKVISINPKQADGYIGRGQAYLYEKKFAEALADYNKAISLDPANSAAYSSRGGLYMLTGNYAGSIADLKEAIRLNPDYSSAYIDLVTDLLRTGQIDETAKYARIYKAKNLKEEQSSGWKFYEHYINALFEVAINKDYTNALNELKTAEIIHASNDEESNKKNSTDNGYIDVLFLKGYVLEQQGNYSLAKTAYSQSLIVNGNQKDIEEDLQRLERKVSSVAKTDKTPPEIQIFSPAADTRSIDIVSDADDKQMLKGIVRDESGVQSVTINGKNALTLESNGEFTQLMNFTEGVNTINIEATDKNGNKATKTISYSVSKKAAPNKNNDGSTVFIPSSNTYHAIIIGEQDYNDINIPTLKKPVQDARDMKELLESQFTFNPENVLLLENKSRSDILEAIISKCSTLTPNDNLLIFYAGHGVAVPISEEKKEGYWIPVDAHKGRVGDYIPFTQIKTALEGSKAKQILIIADACFSGNLSRGLPEDAPTDLQKENKYKSRVAITSGNDEPVDDNSWFLYHLKARLKNNDQKYISAFDLYTQIKPLVARDADNVIPMYKSIPAVGDQGGVFVFIKR